MTFTSAAYGGMTHCRNAEFELKTHQSATLFQLVQLLSASQSYTVGVLSIVMTHAFQYYAIYTFGKLQFQFHIVMVMNLPDTCSQREEGGRIG